VDQHNELAWLALQLAALQREKKLPKMERLLVPYERRARQTREQQKRMVRMIAETFKGPANA
jgi:hypothetical protein